MIGLAVVLAAMNAAPTQMDSVESMVTKAEPDLVAFFGARSLSINHCATNKRHVWHCDGYANDVMVGQTLSTSDLVVLKKGEPARCKVYYRISFGRYGQASKMDVTETDVCQKDNHTRLGVH